MNRFATAAWCDFIGLYIVFSKPPSQRRLDVSLRLGLEGQRGAQGAPGHQEERGQEDGEGPQSGT